MKNNFSENLKKIRKEHHLSQEDLADDLGVSRQAISKWEQAIAYPEMDKIILICDKFHLNIDDLLHKDINEAKGEEIQKKTINQYIDEFLGFITNTVNMFSHMTLKSKIKCLFEQFVMIIILFIVSVVVGNIGHNILNAIFGFLPVNVHYVLYSIFHCIYQVFVFVVSVIILVHVFKTRYLDYYDKVDSYPEELSSKEEMKRHEDKIVIRDPKHSEYGFIHGLFKFVVGMIKVFCFGFGLFLCFLLVGLLCLFVLSFMISGTGIFFIGVILCVLAGAVMDIIVILFIFNFVFNRGNNKKMMIWSFILSFVIAGIGCGFITMGSMDFEVVNDKEVLETKMQELDMNDSMFFHDGQRIEYVVKDISNVIVEYQVNSLCDMSIHDYHEYGVSMWGYCSNPFKLSKEFMRNLNHKKIVTVWDDVFDVKVYASKDNIEKMKLNRINYYENR